MFESKRVVFAISGARIAVIASLVVPMWSTTTTTTTHQNTSSIYWNEDEDAACPTYGIDIV